MAEIGIDVNLSHLDVSGYQDGMIWGKYQGSSESDYTKRGIFPFTRYDCILNRPRVIIPGMTIADTPNTPFNLVVVDEEEMSDDDIFALYGQSW